MDSIIVQPGQTLPDIAVQYCGSISSWPQIAALNGLGLTSVLNAGQIIQVPDASDKRIAAYFKQGGYYPSAGEVPNYGDGIGYWIIESDFIVQ